jgi:hypothetical protein
MVDDASEVGIGFGEQHREHPRVALHPHGGGQGGLDGAAGQLVAEPNGMGTQLQQPCPFRCCEHPEIAEQHLGQPELRARRQHRELFEGRLLVGGEALQAGSTASTTVEGTPSPEPAAATISETKNGLPAVSR